MTTRSASLAGARSRGRAIQDWLMAGALVTTAAGIVVTESLGSSALPAPPGRIVRMGSRRLHILDRPGTPPTVVLESGLGHPAIVWNRVLQQLRDHTPAVAYDRPGVGWSVASHSRRNSARYPRYLLEVLRRSGARAPFVLVGHSVGALLIRIFAERYPELTAGLVFVDSAHPAGYQRSSRRWVGPALSHLDRMITQIAFRPPLNDVLIKDLGSLPVQFSGSTRRAVFRLSLLCAALREFTLSLDDWASGAALLTSVTPCPVAVVSAAATQEDPTYAELAQELAALSRVSRSEIVAGACHGSLLTDRLHVKRVTEAIHWVLDRAALAASTTTASENWNRRFPA